MSPRTYCAHSGARPAIDARNNRFFYCEECNQRVTTAVTGHKGWALRQRRAA